MRADWLKTFVFTFFFFLTFLQPTFTAPLGWMLIHRFLTSFMPIFGDKRFLDIDSYFNNLNQTPQEPPPVFITNNLWQHTCWLFTHVLLPLAPILSCLITYTILVMACRSFYTHSCVVMSYWAHMRLTTLVQFCCCEVILGSQAEPSWSKRQHLAANWGTRIIRVQTFCYSFIQIVNILQEGVTCSADWRRAAAARSQGPGARSQGAPSQEPSLGLPDCTRRQVHVKLTHPLECPDQAETSCFYSSGSHL